MFNIPISIVTNPNPATDSNYNESTKGFYSKFEDTFSTDGMGTSSSATIDLNGKLQNDTLAWSDYWDFGSGPALEYDVAEDYQYGPIAANTGLHSRVSPTAFYDYETTDYCSMYNNMAITFYPSSTLSGLPEYDFYWMQYAGDPANSTYEEFLESYNTDYVANDGYSPIYDPYCNTIDKTGCTAVLFDEDEFEIEFGFGVVDDNASFNTYGDLPSNHTFPALFYPTSNLTPEAGYARIRIANQSGVEGENTRAVITPVSRTENMDIYIDPVFSPSSHESHSFFSKRGKYTCPIKFTFETQFFVAYYPDLYTSDPYNAFQLSVYHTITIRAANNHGNHANQIRIQFSSNEIDVYSIAQMVWGFGRPSISTRLLAPMKYATLNNITKIWSFPEDGTAYESMGLKGFNIIPDGGNKTTINTSPYYILNVGS